MIWLLHNLLHLSAPADTCSIISLAPNMIKKMLLKLVVSLDLPLNGSHKIISVAQRTPCK